MVKALLNLFSFLLISFSIYSQNIKTPSEFLGYELGSEFSRHHEVVNYYKYLEQTLPNQVKLEKYGETYERRPLYVAIISSEKNMRNLESIRINNIEQLKQNAQDSITNDIAIVWLSYNVHGNEASSTEASMQTIYDLLSQKQEWLEHAVIIIDPCLNPDGRDRYVNWFNTKVNKPYNLDQQAIEHYEPWPSGRPNHYLFDLNRDWSWLTQIESQSRLKLYNTWMPHIHVDFHEQGMDDHYYFAPAAEPYHDIITDFQREFQSEIGKNHAKYFDDNGLLYFTKESFDLFYPGYGDTYPTFNGAIGMTYEQAGHGRAGLGIINNEGDTLTLKDRINRHTITGLSTVEIAQKNAESLNKEFRNYFNTKDLKFKSFVVQGHEDKVNSLKNLLENHQIEFGYTTEASVSGYHFTKAKKGTLSTNNSLVINTNQPKGRLVNALFNPVSKLSDSLTYDITAWSLPYAYGLEAIASTKTIASKTKFTNDIESTPDKDCTAYVFKWNHITDAKLLGALLKHKFKVRFTSKEFSTSDPEQTFNKGSLIVTRGDNKHVSNFDTILITIANANSKLTIPIKSGLSLKGPDLGSRYINLINPPEIAVLTGESTNSLSFGSIWHFFEQQLEYPITAIEAKRFQSIDLDKYDVLILPSGYYNSLLNKTSMEKLSRWVKNGGKVIAINGALNSFADKEGFELKRRNFMQNPKDSILIPYEEKERQGAKKMITGAIFKTKVDNTHPLAYGYEKNYFTLKFSNASYSLLKKGHTVTYIEDQTIPVSGFAGSDTRNNLKNSLVIGEERLGKGSIIYFVDDVLYRSFWENGKLFIANAVFLVNNKSYVD